MCLPSLKLTANATENGWLEDETFPFWAKKNISKMPYFQPQNSPFGFRFRAICFFATGALDGFRFAQLQMLGWAHELLGWPVSLWNFPSKWETRWGLSSKQSPFKDVSMFNSSCVWFLSDLTSFGQPSEGKWFQMVIFERKALLKSMIQFYFMFKASISKLQVQKSECRFMFYPL